MRKPLPFIRFYVDDYMADTPHLTAAEHGAYALIMWNYWRRQQPPHESKLPSISKLHSEFELSRETLAEFFDIKEGFWHHKRIEFELKRIKDEAKRNRRAGKKSAEARRKKAEFNKRSTNDERALNDRSQSVEQVIRSNENSANPVPIARQRLTKTENELTKARERVWALERQAQAAQSDLDGTGGFS